MLWPQRLLDASGLTQGMPLGVSLTLPGAVSILTCVTKAPTKAPKSRIDALLVERGLVESRQQARAILLAGDIRVDGAAITKPGVLVADSAVIDVLHRPAYVSRGGDKLEHALRAFAIDVTGLTCLDAGTSTGGFTDCLLQHGAQRVYAVDVGYGVLDYRLRQDERVVVMERTNVRDLTPLPEACDIAVIDVSFIGLEKVLPAICRSLRAGASVVALVKPQFQARREEVGKKGVVKDVQVHAAVIGRVVAWAADHCLHLQHLTTSPLLGPAGNREFFVHLRLESPCA
jgi:23S rRNA (cytidine1920-2'-O)/16S rRNA (cytidine1409-2'-O)-methyltransferase